ncbi:vWA domain-containing protein [Hymenobacter siberiensis]|uniref:vWA domain-containing protein n=1 Tax=Hymenobacter siberiensis TaxID=2848396 RepID=UPI001C1E1A35|nr:vWA domain-containing protein [Hymenobacter siberiensis]MBU6122262.1 VWA domain-containing protein [Hymenobacter siberiensis]
MSDRPATRYKVFHLLLLDESGSMSAIRQPVIDGFNATAQTVMELERQFPDQEHRICLVTFKGTSVRMPLFDETASELPRLNAESYHPRGATPLHDAMGQAITRLRVLTDGHADHRVLVTVLTDGIENASCEYSQADIQVLVEELTEKNWTFTYYGANHDARRAADSLSIRISFDFAAAPEAMPALFARDRESRLAYSRRLQAGKDVSRDYFSTDPSAN